MNKTPTLDGNDGVPARALTAEEIEAKFDAGEDVSTHVNWESGVWVEAGKPTPGQRWAMEEVVGLADAGPTADRELVRVTLPAWAYIHLTNEAGRQGVSREDLVRQIVVRQLEREKIPS